jgi:ribosome maturation factor RimP
MNYLRHLMSGGQVPLRFRGRHYTRGERVAVRTVSCPKERLLGEIRRVEGEQYTVKLDTNKKQYRAHVSELEAL